MTEAEKMGLIEKAINSQMGRAALAQTMIAPIRTRVFHYPEKRYIDLELMISDVLLCVHNGGVYGGTDARLSFGLSGWAVKDMTTGRLIWWCIVKQDLEEGIKKIKQTDAYYAKLLERCLNHGVMLPVLCDSFRVP